MSRLERIGNIPPGLRFGPIVGGGGRKVEVRVGVIGRSDSERCVDSEHQLEGCIDSVY